MRWTQAAPSSAVVSFASALSLANFQQISPGAVSILCLITYDSPIAACTKADFADGAACSAACIKGLQTINLEVNEACQGIKVSPVTLLGMVFQNKMVGALCPNSITSSIVAATPSATAITASSPKPATSMTARRSATASANPTALPTSLTSGPSPSKISTSTIPSATSTFKSLTTSTPVSTTSTVSSTSRTTENPSTATPTSTSKIAITTANPIPTSMPTSLAVDTTQTRSSTKSTKTVTASTNTAPAAPQKSQASEQQQQIDASKDTGGGSPFDIVDSRAAPSSGLCISGFLGLVALALVTFAVI